MYQISQSSYFSDQNERTIEDEGIKKRNTILPSATTNEEESGSVMSQIKKDSASSHIEATVKTTDGNAVKVEKRYW